MRHRVKIESIPKYMEGAPEAADKQSVDFFLAEMLQSLLTEKQYFELRYVSSKGLTDVYLAWEDGGDDDMPDGVNILRNLLPHAFQWADSNDVVIRERLHATRIWRRLTLTPLMADYCRDDDARGDSMTYVLPELRQAQGGFDGVHQTVFAAPVAISEVVAHRTALQTAISRLSAASSSPVVFAFLVRCVMPAERRNLAAYMGIQAKELADGHAGIPKTDVQAFFNGWTVTPAWRIEMTSYAASKADSRTLAMAAVSEFSNVFALGSTDPVLYVGQQHEVSMMDSNAVEHCVNTLRFERPQQGDDEQVRQALLALLPQWYTLEDASALLRLPYASIGQTLPGLRSHLMLPFQLPEKCANTTEDAQIIDVGRYADSLGASEERAWLHMGSLNRHVFVTGASGSGKTEAAITMIHALLRKRVHCMIFEPSIKAEYAVRLGNANGLVRTGYGANDPCLAYDPFQLVSENVDIETHVQNLVAAFSSAFPMNEAQLGFLEMGIRRYYAQGPVDVHRRMQLRKTTTPGKDRHPDDISWSIFPSFRNFVSFFLNVVLKNLFPNSAPETMAELKAFFDRRFKAILEGPVGKGIQLANDVSRLTGAQQLEVVKEYGSGSSTITIYTLPRPQTDFEKNMAAPCWVMELAALGTREAKALVMSFLLTAMAEYVSATRTPNQTNLLNFLLLEEAHAILGGREAGRSAEVAGLNAAQRAQSTFANLLREIRSYGMGVSICEQSPAMIIPDAIRNTAVKIMFRLPAREDRDVMASAMNLTDSQTRAVVGLRPGQAVVYTDTFDEPSLVQFDRIQA